MSAIPEQTPLVQQLLGQRGWVQMNGAASLTTAELTLDRSFGAQVVSMVLQLTP